MRTVVLGNLRWQCHSPSLYQLLCPAPYDIWLAYTGEVWALQGNGMTVAVPDRDTGAMLVAKQLAKDATGNGP